MMSFRRRLVAALLGTIDPSARPAVEAFVEASLADMPHHLQLGIAADSLLLEFVCRATHGGLIPDDAALVEMLASWETSPLTPIRQYARLLSSLVLFADQEHRPPHAALDAGRAS
jgi:hypothetical protein